MSFKDKVVLVTGASSGIGAATAVQFSKEGARVVLVGRNVNKLGAVAAKCQNPLVICADLAIEKDVKRIMQRTIEKFGKLNILVNNAGFTTPSLINNKAVMECYDKVMAVNLRAIVLLTNLAAPYLIETKGNIVNVSSIAGQKPPHPGFSIYFVSKAALNHFTICSAAEFAPNGVRVNAISPGPVRTDFGTFNGEPTPWDILQRTTALDRVSGAEEIADLVLFLASDNANAITGSNFVSDNGILVKQ